MEILTNTAMNTTSNTCSGAVELLASILLDNEITPQDFAKHPYVIAIDLGGGNSSAAYIDASEGTTANLTNIKPNVANLDALSSKSKWSTIGYTTDNKILIGRSAKLYGHGVYSNYKCCPTDLNLKTNCFPDKVNGKNDKTVKRSVEQLTKDYLENFFDAIRRFNPTLKEAPLDKMLLIVGCPSSKTWQTDECHKNFKRIIKEATGVGKVMILSEAKAAIMYTRGNGANIRPVDSVIIFDLGAVTFDMIWIDRRSNCPPKEASMNLGGNAVDKNLGKIVLQKSKLKEDDIQIPLSLDCRIIKERFWPKETGTQFISLQKDLANISITSNDFLKAVNDSNYSIEVYDGISDRDFTDTYLNHIKRFMEECKNTLQIKDVDWVLITGGSARIKPAMDTITNMASKLWGVDQDHIYPKEISEDVMNEAVTFGSLFYYEKAMEVLIDLPNLYDALVKEVQELVDPLVEACYKDLAIYSMKEFIKPAALAWKNTTNGCDIYNLKYKISNAFAEPTEQQKNSLNAFFAENLEKVYENRLWKFQSLITTFLKKHYETKSSQMFCQPSFKGIHPDKFKEVILITLEEHLKSFWDNTLIGMLLLMLFVSGIGLAAIAIEVLYDTLYETFATNDQKQKREQKQREKDCNKRSKIYNKLTSEKMQNDLAKKLKEALTTELRHAFEDNALGIPDIFIQQATEDIQKAIYSV